MAKLGKSKKKRACKKNKSLSRLKSRDFVSKSGIGYLSVLERKNRQYIEQKTKSKVTISVEGVAVLKITRPNLKNKPFEHLSFNRAWKGL